MGLAGNAAVIIWNDVLEGARADFLAWHNREHMLERVGIPGFHRGRRGCAVTGGPEFLTLYEVEDGDVLVSGPYLERLDAPSVWTRRVLPQFRNTARSLCRTEVSLGGGIGGFMATVRLSHAVEASDAAGVRTAFSRAASQVLRSSPEVTGTHLLLRDLAASRREIAEGRLRTESVAMPATILLVEANSARPAEEGARLIAEAVGESCRELSAGILGLYRHEFCLMAGDCARLQLAAEPA